MSDAELIDWLRRQHATTHGVGFVEILRQVACRLESLTRSAPGGPVSAARLAEIRHVVLARMEHSAETYWSDHAARDLLAAYDDALAWLSRFASDSEAYRAGKEAGVAGALQVLRTLSTSYDTPHHNTTYAEGRKEGHRDAVANVEHRCGPAELPPHERLAADNRRLREALGRIARGDGDGDGDEVSWSESSLMWQRIAREALEG